MQRNQYVMTFGDAWDLRSFIGSTSEECARGPRLSVGAYRVPLREHFSDFRALKRRVRAEIMDHVVEHDPDVLVLVLDATDRWRIDKTESLARHLAMDAAHTSAMLTGRDLSAVPVIVRDRVERDLLARALLTGRFHRVVADGSIAIDVTQMRRAPPQALISEGEI